jgi:predicted nucleic acid-binding Zn ribbon protein
MLRGLDQALGSFGSHPLWAELKQMQTLRQIWPELVGDAVAAQTYPLSVRRQVLQVATSTPAWAQNLAFQRQLILKKLNSRLHPPFSDIRFSPGAWHEGSGPATALHPDVELTGKFYNAPRQDGQPPGSLRNSAPQQPPSDPKAAFERWARVVKQQQTQQNMFPCPTCRCPTPAAELERWFVCGFCHRQKTVTKTINNQSFMAR